MVFKALTTRNLKGQRTAILHHCSYYSINLAIGAKDLIFFRCLKKPSKDIMEKPCTTNADGHNESKESRDGLEGMGIISVDMKLHPENSNEELDDSSRRISKNIILNHDFSGGLDLWHPNCCDAYIVSGENGHPGESLSKLQGRFAVVTNRKECWQGLEQDITDRVTVSASYSVCAWVAISGDSFHGAQDVLATLKLEKQDGSVDFVFIGRTSASMDRWEKVEGNFSLDTPPRHAIFYLEGPSNGVNLLIRSVMICCSQRSTLADDDENIVQNPQFDDCLNSWSGRGCNAVLRDSMAEGKVLPKTGKFFASTANRSQNWNGIQQEISGRVQRKLAYEVFATVRIFGDNITSSEVRATLWLNQDDREQYIGISSAQATDNDWVQLHGKFLINGSPSRAVIFLEGPPPGTDILLNNLTVRHAAKVPPPPPPGTENVDFGVNVIANSNLNDGTNGWFPLGDCTLTAQYGSPHFAPPMARDSLGFLEPLSGRYILTTHRTQTWMGPAQMITEKVKLYLTYQVSAWVQIGNQAAKPQNINIALGVDTQWVNGGQVECANDGRWHEIGGSFRIEKPPSKIMVYVQGPDPGVDLMLAGLQIFPVDRRLRFRKLKKQTDTIRKRDVILKLRSSDSSKLLGSSVKIRQTQSSFPIGSCIGRANMDNEDIAEFFTQNFNWGVFENELKWYWTEPQQGNLNYRDAEDLLKLCNSHGIQVRGHCIFWEVESAVPSWVRSLNKNDMMLAIDNRLNSLLTKYMGSFKHYDVNNEMLHGSFFKDHLGDEIRATMFKKASLIDPSATLFMNDYNVEDGFDARSSPEKYIDHILCLQEQGAPVGGIGIQGHTNSPVGSIVCSALDKLAILGLPIWFTELDVASENEYIRADDLEVMLREAFAHPAVGGIMLWGFWELCMSRQNAHLVNAEGDINEAGRRLLALKKEWSTHIQGCFDEQGQVAFRGFHGSYEAEIELPTGKVRKTFVIEQGNEPLVIYIDL